jgi:alpha-L-fucosidase
LLTPVVYIPPATPSLVMPIAQTILVVNLPPLGCIPALLTLYGGPEAKYNSHGCLESLNSITKHHNKLLGERVAALRIKYPDAKLLYGDAHGVYTDIPKHPAKYSTQNIRLYCIKNLLIGD